MDEQTGLRIAEAVRLECAKWMLASAASAKGRAKAPQDWRTLEYAADALTGWAVSRIDLLAIVRRVLGEKRAEGDVRAWGERVANAAVAMARRYPEDFRGSVSSDTLIPEASIEAAGPPPSVPSSTAWQPIDTAQDGAAVLLWGPGWEVPRIARYQRDAHASPHATYPATHWAQAPTPPRSKP